MLAHGAASARQVLEAAGAARILDSGRVMNFAHYMGTARVGAETRRHRSRSGEPGTRRPQTSSLWTAA